MPTTLPLTCLALDDEPLALRILQQYTDRLPDLKPLGFFTDPERAKDCIATQDIDLFFLDIDMPDISGLQFLRLLPQPPMVIFSTAYRNYAVEGFELNAVDYIVKPYPFERFHHAVQKAQQQRVLRQQPDRQQQDFLWVRSAYELLKIDLKDLYLVETAEDYLLLHLFSRPKPIYTLMTLKTMENKLPSASFKRVHRSYLVGINAVEQVRRKKIIVNGRQIPIGITYRADVQKWLLATHH